MIAASLLGVALGPPATPRSEGRLRTDTLYHLHILLDLGTERRAFGGIPTDGSEWARHEP